MASFFHCSVSRVITEADRPEHVGDLAGFAPPGDIHRVRNTSETKVISIHIDGTDLICVGSSARRYYN